MFASLRATLLRKARLWAWRRQGPDGQQITLARRRVYILPTRQGLLYGLTLFVMLLGSMNYSNSMGFMLTFLLAALGLIAMHACHANLNGLTLAVGKVDAVFAGEVARFHIRLFNAGRTHRPGLVIGAEAGDATVNGDLDAGEHGDIRVPLPTRRRGWLVLGRLSVETTYPLGLFRAWSWVHMEMRTLVYPAPAAYGPPLPQPAEGYGSGRPNDQGDEDFSGLRSYRAGDSPRHIAWKVSAREQMLLTKQFTGSGEQTRWLDANLLPQFNPEQRLSILCRWVLDAHAQNLHYGLRLPGESIAPGSGDAQRERCLQALALFGTDPSSRDTAT
ncbi:MAG TPA: DUF58 domain-containing protein [Gammaproteobacteria bacterium]|jgi:uncharacterized protein (DUF58 family)|nr:DUF58 domain-containing protein [Gammaproteobacteria bacterium]